MDLLLQKKSNHVLFLAGVFPTDTEDEILNNIENEKIYISKTEIEYDEMSEYFIDLEHGPKSIR